MQQLLSVWAVMDMRKRVIIILATVAMFASVLGLSRMATRPTMSLLYAGLEASQAGNVIKALEASGASYDVRGGAIYVDATRRDELRMAMASEGLPENSGAGYEILDNLSGFGTTAQMFDAAYWRAQEGELARTIMSSSMIRSARVHLGNPSPRGLRQQSAPSASVTIATFGSTLSPSQAKAFKYLVASAVPGLLPENVSVIDTRTGLVNAGDETGAGIENSDKADVLRANIERLLEARVGPGNAVVEVNVETVTERESIVERTVDPDSRIAISSDTTEVSNSSSDSRNTGVSVASNLPSGDAAAGDGQSSSSANETRERVNFEISETTREVLRVPGAVRRLSVAVLVDGIRGIDANGEPTWTPRSEEEMANLRDLVSSVVGYNEARGDIITLKSLEFEPIEVEENLPEPGLFQSLQLDVMALVQIAVLFVVSLVLGLFVLRPILSARGPAVDPSLLPAANPELTGPNFGGQSPAGMGVTTAADNGAQPESSTLPALTGEIDPAGGGFPEMSVVPDFGFDDDTALPSLDAPSADPVERLRALIDERQSETVEILRGWMENAEDTV